MKNPLAEIWPAMEKDLLAQAPERCCLPREEIFRFLHTMFNLGIAAATLGVASVDLANEDMPVEEREYRRAGFLQSIGDMIHEWDEGNINVTCDQMVAVMKAHAA